MTQAPLTFHVHARATAEVDVDLTRQELPPRFFSLRYAILVVTDEPPRRLERLHANLRKFGTVYNTLTAVRDVAGTVEAVPRT